MKRNNYIVRISMNKREAEHFSAITPLIHLSLSDKDSNIIAHILGYSNAKTLLTVGFKSNPFLRSAFDDFFNRLVFTDKEVERKVKSTLLIKPDKNTLSKLELELMWLLETDRDELDYHNI